MSDSVIFVDKHVLAARIGYSAHSFKRFRREGTWVKGVHYIVVNSRSIRYNLQICMNWLVNRHNPKAHKQFVENFLAQMNEQIVQ